MTKPNIDPAPGGREEPGDRFRDRDAALLRIVGSGLILKIRSIAPSFPEGSEALIERICRRLDQAFSGEALP